jgi:hypothetical protein
MAAFWSLAFWLGTWTTAAVRISSRTQICLAALYVAGWFALVTSFAVLPASFTDWFLD